jgi:uncharacterized membrane protein
MPCQWIPASGDAMELHLWPHRSLPQRGFVWFIGLTAALAAVPLLVHLGSPVLWVLLVFTGLALAAVWLALQRSFRDGEILEVLRLTQEEVQLTRHGPRRQRQHWAANRHWVRLALHETGGPVPNYLTLQGGGRIVELGAFLSEAERISLYQDLRRQLSLAG